MLQMLVQNLQLLYHNHQQQVDMNYMLLNPPRGINRRETMATMLGGLLHCFFVAEVTTPLSGYMYYSVSSPFERCCAEVQRYLQARHMYYSVSSGLVWTDTLNEPNACERKTFLKTNSVSKRKRPRVNGVQASGEVCVKLVLRGYSHLKLGHWQGHFCIPGP